MATAEVVQRETEEERIERWRTEVLSRAGYDAEGAEQLARRTDVDLHLAVELVERGCPPPLALEILL
jgi:hypothetical protein